MPNHAAFNWKFHRIGGLDQVTLRTPEELLHLNELDPKLWVALSCPIDKLQFDARTLELLDADKDGRIRIQEVLDAVRWTVDRLSDPALLAESRPELALEESGRIRMKAVCFIPQQAVSSRKVEKRGLSRRRM